MAEPIDTPDTADLWGVATRRMIEHRRLESLARERAAAFAAEASWERWMALGCPADREGVMGNSLLETPRKRAADAH